MGIPYSREINAAFEQVTPLVAAGYKVLRTTKNISIILAIIQVLTVVLLGLILLALVALLYTVNPDLEVRCPKFTSLHLNTQVRMIMLTYTHSGRKTATHHAMAAILRTHHALRDSQDTGYDRADACSRCFCGLETVSLRAMG
jgi:hypothetical protein